MTPLSHRAWVWTGGAVAGDLQLVETARPMPEAGDVLIRNVVIGLNPVDWKVLSGGLVTWEHGHVPGVDGAGLVVAAGDGVPQAWIGQRVAYHQHLARHGSFAEYTAVKARALLRVPAGVRWADAASLPCPALTGWLALQKLPAACQTLLVSGAGGSVAHHLIQLAARRGLKITTLSHSRHFPKLRSLGVHECLQGPLSEEWEGTARFDAVVDTISATHAAWLAPALRVNGHLVCVQDRLAAPVVPPFTRTLSVHEVALGASHVFGDMRTWQELVDAGEWMLEAIGRQQWLTDTVVEAPFEELASHLRGLHERSYTGKAIVRLADRDN